MKAELHIHKTRIDKIVLIINPVKISMLKSMFIVSFKTGGYNKCILETVGFPLWYRKISVMPKRKY